MADIALISAAAQSILQNTQSALGVQAMKQAADAQKLLADMLAENAKQAQTAPERTAKSGISIYV